MMKNMKSYRNESPRVRPAPTKLAGISPCSRLFSRFLQCTHDACTSIWYWRNKCPYHSNYHLSPLTKTLLHQTARVPRERWRSLRSRVRDFDELRHHDWKITWASSNKSSTDLLTYKYLRFSSDASAAGISPVRLFECRFLSERSGQP